MDPAILQTPDLALPSTRTSLESSPHPTAEQTADLAREFESMLILQMLRQMQRSMLSEQERETGFGSGPLGDTLQQEVARQIAGAGGLGLSDELAQALARQTGVAASDPAPAGPPSPGPPAAASGARLPGAGGRGVPAPRSAVPLPIGARVTSPFGWRSDPIDGQARFHGGVDIRAAQDDPVPAAKAGRVVFAGTQGGYGTTVVLEHDGGVQTRYAHLAGLEVEQGERVRAGQSIGRVGQTGRATGPHLHFEVLHGGQRVDPVLAARRFAEALKKVEQVADLNDGGSENGPGIALE